MMLRSSPSIWTAASLAKAIRPVAWISTIPTGEVLSTRSRRALASASASSARLRASARLLSSPAATAIDSPIWLISLMDVGSGRRSGVAWPTAVAASASSPIALAIRRPNQLAAAIATESPRRPTAVSQNSDWRSGFSTASTGTPTTARQPVTGDRT